MKRRFTMSNKRTGMEGPEAEGSTPFRHKSSKGSLEKKWAWANTITGARVSSAEIYAANITSTDRADLSQMIIDKLGQLEGKFKSHPKPRYPEGQEATWRRLTPGRDSLPKVTQSYDATQNIIKNVASLRDILLDPQHPLASRLSQKAHQEIPFS